MAEPLKNNFGPEMVHRAASTIAEVYPPFDVKGFTKVALDGFEDLELTPRCQQIADAMAQYLPEDREQSLQIVVDSFGPELENCDPDDATGVAGAEGNPVGGFFYMSHGYFISDHGGDHFELAMQANYELTKRFTAEFSVRSQLRDNPAEAFALLAEWATDPNVHVRRLVSEGTRSRLPWSFRLKNVQQDPSLVLPLLEQLKDDPVAYVRRSVANNLNDIAKDHPDVVIDVARRWWKDADKNRQRLVRHGLRTLIKAGNTDALDVLGFGSDTPAVLAESTIEPTVANIGDKVKVQAIVENPSDKHCGVLVDLRIHFVKANGSTSPKVFKGAERQLGPGESTTVKKAISVAQQSTRTHHPGKHRVEVLINGNAHEAGAFHLTES